MFLPSQRVVFLVHEAKNITIHRYTIRDKHKRKRGNTVKEHTISALFPGAGKPLLSFNTPDCCLVTANTHARPYPYISCSLSQTLHYTTGEESPPYVQHMLITENKALFVFHTFSSLWPLYSALFLFALCSLSRCEFAGTWNNVSLLYWDKTQGVEEIGQEGGENMEADRMNMWSCFLF